jgi:hypothetical protein
VFFRAPRGAAVKVKYGHGWFSLNVQKQTMDRATHEKLKVDSASIAYARMRMKVPVTMDVEYDLHPGDVAIALPEQQF